jgi:hypothetical protein
VPGPRVETALSSIGERLARTSLFLSHTLDRIAVDPLKVEDLNSKEYSNGTKTCRNGTS